MGSCFLDYCLRKDVRNSVELAHLICTDWPCDGCYRRRPASWERTPPPPPPLLLPPPIEALKFRRLLFFLDFTMTADTHVPSSRGILCNAGAGAAAGKSVLLVWILVFWVNFVTIAVFLMKFEDDSNIKHNLYTPCDCWTLACLTGVIAATFVCPLDVIKTRLQVHGLPKLTNTNIKGPNYLWISKKREHEYWYLFLYNWLGSIIVGSLEQIFKREGLRGMYRGLSPTVLALLPNWAVSVLLYLLHVCYYCYAAWCNFRGI